MLGSFCKISHYIAVILNKMVLYWRYFGVILYKMTRFVRELSLDQLLMWIEDKITDEITDKKWLSCV